LRVSDAITADGGANPERIKPLVTAEQYANFSESAATLTEKGWHTSGRTTFRKLSLAQADLSAEMAAAIDLYVCVDVSAVRIIDTLGQDVTPTTRLDAVPIEIGFVAASEGWPALALSRSESWTGTDFC
jgi:hypothetical protein